MNKDSKQPVDDIQFDWQRAERTGVAEAVLCLNKSTDQVSRILRDANEKKRSLLLTRLQPAMANALLSGPQDGASPILNLDYDPVSLTGILNNQLPSPMPSNCLIVTAGTSDLPVALEARRTLRFHGLDVAVIGDCGVAGLWRLTDKLAQLRAAPVIIAVAGMEGALFPVLGGLVPGIVIAVPGSTGYGVAEGGHTALHTALATCAPGVVTVNIDNGFGAAGALLKILRLHAHA
ncbi:MAG: nickel pincer cofactor biosynthesis protein LarB [Burkholderiaceae bacterium]